MLFEYLMSNYKFLRNKDAKSVLPMHISLCINLALV